MNGYLLLSLFFTRQAGPAFIMHQFNSEFPRSSMCNPEKQNLEKLFFILSYGLTECLKNKAITIDEAETLLYRPGLMTLLEKANCSNELIDLIHMGTELEDAESLAPNRLEGDIEEMSLKAMGAIKQLPTVTPSSSFSIGNLVECADLSIKPLMSALVDCKQLLRNYGLSSWDDRIEQCHRNLHDKPQRYHLEEILSCFHGTDNLNEVVLYNGQYDEDMDVNSDNKQLDQLREVIYGEALRLKRELSG